MRSPNPSLAAFLPLLGLCVLSACGGGNGENPVAPPLTPERGELLANPPQLMGGYGTDILPGLIGANSVAGALLTIGFTATCGVNVYQLQYETVGALGEYTTASGALMTPAGSAAGCSGPRPIVMYAHGTTPDETFNIADLSRSDNDEGLMIAALFASQGYIVVAPNYAGYDISTLGYHPYLVADQQSKDMIDALTAARTALPATAAPAVSDNGQLFITGYSQGGFVALATQRALEAAGQTVTAAAPMSGPYALAAFGDALFDGEVTLSSTENITLLVNSYQHAYGNIYSQPSDLFGPQYAPTIAGLLPSTTSISSIYAQGLLPQNALFSSTPPAAQYASITPATTPAELAPAFALGFGTGNLITNSYRLSYLQDAVTAPDGGYPTLTTGLPAAAPAEALRQALKTNDLRGFMPAAPVLLCAGSSDPTVLFLDTQLMQDYWSSHPPTLAPAVLDVDSPPTGNDPYAALKDGFAAAKAAVAGAAVAGGATDGGALAVLQDYHATLVPPFCFGAAKSFSDAHSNGA